MEYERSGRCPWSVSDSKERPRVAARRRKISDGREVER